MKHKRYLGSLRSFFGVSAALAIGIFSVGTSAYAHTNKSTQQRKLEKLGVTLPAAADSGRGSAVFKTVCSACHEHGVSHAPSIFVLRSMTPEAIYKVLTTGPMRIPAAGISIADKKAVAHYLGKGNISAGRKLEPPACKGEAAYFDFNKPPAFQGWGVSLTNTRNISQSVSDINPENIRKLKLKWALGIPGGTRMRSEPAVAGGAIYVGSDSGTVYALNRRSGCLRWKFSAAAEVRTGIVISSWKAGNNSAKPIAYFGDLVGNIYAVDAVNGKLIWKAHVDSHPSVTLTATPVLYKRWLYVPVSSLEEGDAMGQGYPCCTFRGSIIAYNAKTGRRKWKTYMVRSPVLEGHNAMGTKQYGPSGVALWNTPAVDAKRGLLYFGTGDNYSQPTTGKSDAIVAVDLANGKIKWVFQTWKGDAWNGSCELKDKPSCTFKSGPDYDFGASVILATLRSGRQLIVAAQKSGWVYALNPNTHKLVWKTRVGRGGLMAGVYFGMAQKGDSIFVPVNDAPDGRHYATPARPGLYALDLRNGQYLWRSPNSDARCKGKGVACWQGIAAAPTVTGNLVIDGAGDGWLRIYDARTGKILWRLNTTKSVMTVGGGRAAGGSIGGGASPLLYNGSLIVESGYGFAGRMPGNVMLVYGTK